MNIIPVLIGLFVAYIITSSLDRKLVPFLHKLKYGQTIKEIGPTWHKSKQGTPTMGGVMFILGIMIASIFGFLILYFNEGYKAYNDITVDGIKLFSGLFMALGFGMIGFLDDYIKVVKKRNLGLLARYKTILQIIVAGFYLAGLYVSEQINTAVVIPFVGQFEIGFLYYPLAMFIIIGAVNAVNLTDGVDGLASTITAVVGISFVVIASMLKMLSTEVMAACLLGGCLGFLKWNKYPAKVFMGDTGSMFLGGMVVALAFSIGIPIILIFVGIVYIVETMSVIMQVISFKLTGKRIFKMSPIHHHFEMSGYSENKIVLLFSFVTMIGCLIAVLSIHMLK